MFLNMNVDAKYHPSPARAKEFIRARLTKRLSVQVVAAHAAIRNQTLKTIP
jgi:hypothetical protein